VHLVTKEAFDLYLKHLAPDGVHPRRTSRIVILIYVPFLAISEILQLKDCEHRIIPAIIHGGYPTEWLLLARDPQIVRDTSDQISFNGSKAILNPSQNLD